MSVRCLRSSFATRRFVWSSSVVESSISSNKPARHVRGSLAERLLSFEKNDSGGAATVIANWKEEGRVVSKHQIIYAVRRLIIRKGYAKALMICDSMLKIKDFKLNPIDYAVHIDLISRVRGLYSAEKYFDSIPEEMNGEITSTALIRILVKKGETLKAEALMEKMKKSGFLSNPEPYVHMMYLYFSKEQIDKAEEKNSEMNSKMKKCISPDVRIYNTWLSAFASGKNGGEGGERATFAGMRMKKKLFERAGAALKEMEEVDPRSGEVYCHLIRIHGIMRNKDEVLGIWDKLKRKTKWRSNSEYAAMVWSLLKLDLFEEAEEILKEWDSFLKTSNSRKNPIFRSTLVLLKEYKKGES